VVLNPDVEHSLTQLSPLVQLSVLIKKLTDKMINMHKFIKLSTMFTFRFIILLFLFLLVVRCKLYYITGKLGQVFKNY